MSRRKEDSLKHRLLLLAMALSATLGLLASVLGYRALRALSVAEQADQTVLEFYRQKLASQRLEKF